MRLANLPLLNVATRRNLPLSKLLQALLSLSLLLASTSQAFAGGPRWFSGPPYFWKWYVQVAWYTNQPLYFTDPGDLSASVNHAAADAMVAKAAAIWNIPTASLVLTQGGALNQHVSSANIAATGTGLTFPSDVQAGNYQAKQIAVIYDTDGSVTDMLLGSGASDPSSCLQNGVTESVDYIGGDGNIYHAMLILNGRCTGSEPEKQLQMQYQLERMFGRILGLSWSQTNDNVFTGSPAPTATQALNWPIMHPIDIVCGPYTYQCLPQPFTLRPDDISSLESLYFIRDGQAAAGKQASWSNAGGVYGAVNFPNGQGMEGVNVVVHRRAPFWDTAEDWETASSITGFGFRGESTTSIAAADTSLAGSLGAPGSDWEGTFHIASIPVPPSQSWTDLVVSTQAVNPLYSGPYAIGPQSGNTMSPSGSPQVQVSQYLANGRYNGVSFTVPDAAPSCSAQTDGTEGAPTAAAPSGWWTGTLCGYLHQAWSSVSVKANRTLALEVTALDEQGQVSMTKAMPAIGVWRSADATGTLPTVASAAKAFNTFTVGLTSVRLQSSTVPTSFRVDIADQRGAGRPDFAYQARVLYADSVAPSILSADGGAITITGMGFRQGNTVLINGTAATVSSWTANTIVATAPSLHTLGLTRQTVATITVGDPSTGSSSTMSAALSYAAPVEALQLVSAPASSVPAGTAAPVAFAVKAIAPDGFTSIVGEAVSFVATGGTFAQCASSTCTLTTNSAGIASATVTPTAAGTVTLTATGRSGSVSASFTATSNASVLHILSAPTGVATIGAPVVSPVWAQLVAADGVTPRSGTNVTIRVTAGSARLAACSAASCVLTTDTQGMVSTKVTPMAAGTISIQVAAPSTSTSVSFSAAPETMQLAAAPAATQTVGIASSTMFQIKVLAGDGVTPAVGESIVLSAAGGSVRFNACGSAVCTLTTDAQGLVQSSVTPLTPATITLSALGGAGAVTANFTAASRVQAVTPTKSVQYVAEATTIVWTPQVTLSDNAAGVSGLSVTWTGATGFAFASSSSVTGAAGTSAELSTIGPLRAGQQVGGSVCAWVSVCTPLTVVGVATSDLRLTAMTGAAQSVSSTATLSPVTFRVTDINGNPVAGVAVHFEQTVNSWEAACTTSGRCPPASVLAAVQSSTVSGVDGIVTLQPAEILGTPSLTQIAAIAGNAGFATISAEKHP